MPNDLVNAIDKLGPPVYGTVECEGDGLCIFKHVFPPGRDNITAPAAAACFGRCYSDAGFSSPPGSGAGSGSGFSFPPLELDVLDALLEAALDELDELDELLELDDSLGSSSSPPMIVTSLVKSQVRAGL